VFEGESAPKDRRISASAPSHPPAGEPARSRRRARAAALSRRRAGVGVRLVKRVDGLVHSWATAPADDLRSPIPPWMSDCGAHPAARTGRLLAQSLCERSAAQLRHHSPPGPAGESTASRVCELQDSSPRSGPPRSPSYLVVEHDLAQLLESVDLPAQSVPIFYLSERQLKIKLEK